MTLSTSPEVFKKIVNTRGDRVAMRKKEYGVWQDITWNEYYDRSLCVGAALLSLGLQKGDAVSIIGDNCPEWVLIDMGIQCAGGVVVGIYATNAWQQVEYVIQNSESRFFFLENEEQLDKWLHFREPSASSRRRRAPHSTATATPISWDRSRHSTAHSATCHT